MEINDHILKQATKCENNFECLVNPEYLCMIAKVERSINGEVLFLDCKKRNCNYYQSFGNKVICSCPTRNAIYKKYKK